MKLRLLTLLLIPPFMNAMEVEQHALITRDPVKLLHDKTHYYVSDENASYRVSDHEVSPLLKQVLKRNALTEFARQCKIQIKKHDDKTYSLIEKVPGQGGGFITGIVAAWTVRAGGYGAFAVACAFHPELLLEAHVAHAAIESTALAAQVAGTALPTP